ncbi:MAG: zf-HC2 domain-containing protein [Candidatus Brocadiae bacterium]|nr:zf-HC2 domain-containing protein [Candidatus Brocadiia bacterium]
MSAECEGHRQRFSEYLDDALDQAERDALEAHVAECAACRRELDVWRRTIGAVAGLPVHRPAAGFADRVVRRLSVRAPQRPLVTLLWSRALPVAAMLLVVLGLVFSIHGNGIFKRDAERLELALARPAAPEDVLQPVEFDEALEPAEREALATIAAKAAPAAAPGELTERLSAAAMEEVTDVADELRPLSGLAAPARAARAERPVKRAEDAYAEEAPPESAFSWREVGRAGEAGAALDESARRFVSGREAVPALEARSGELVFGQVAVAGLDAKARPVQQVLTLVGEDPAVLAHRAVTVANASGVPATLSLRGDGDGGAMELRLTVPLAQYDALVQGLVRLTPPERQMLTNTLAAEGEFFRVALANYTVLQSGRLQVKDAEQEKVSKETVADVVPAPRLRVGAGRAAGLVAEPSAPEAERPTSPINLLIRIYRPAPVEKE